MKIIHSKHLKTHDSASSTSKSHSLIVTQFCLHSVWKSVNEVPTLGEPNDSGILSKTIALGGKTIAIGCIIASLHTTFGASAGTSSFFVCNVLILLGSSLGFTQTKFCIGILEPHHTTTKVVMPGTPASGL